MRESIRKTLNGITPSSIEKYLMLTGWNRVAEFNGRMLIFENKADTAFRIAVPANENLGDFYDRVYDLVQMLCSYSNETEQAIIDSLKSAFTDRIQFRIITGASKDGKIPLEYAASCIEGLKDLVLYAACAEENARPICMRAYNVAKSNLEKFQFEQTEIGSFIFSVGVQVADDENEQLYLEEVAPPPEEPTEHKIVKRIETAMKQVEDVVNRQVKVSDLIEYAYQDGLTANMCDAFMKLRPTKGEEIILETSIHYAEAITREVEPPTIRAFDNIHFAFVDEISNRYKDCTLIEDVALSGSIRMLAKSGSGTDVETENKVRLLTKYDGKQRGVDLLLAPADHAAACDAYRDDKEVVVTGTLDKSGKYWFFSEVTKFEVKE